MVKHISVPQKKLGNNAAVTKALAGAMFREADKQRRVLKDDYAVLSGLTQYLVSDPVLLYMDQELLVLFAECSESLRREFIALLRRYTVPGESPMPSNMAVNAGAIMDRMIGEDKERAACVDRLLSISMMMIEASQKAMLEITQKP